MSILASITVDPIAAYLAKDLVGPKTEGSALAAIVPFLGLGGIAALFAFFVLAANAHYLPLDVLLCFVAVSIWISSIVSIRFLDLPMDRNLGYLVLGVTTFDIIASSADLIADL